VGILASHILKIEGTRLPHPPAVDVYALPPNGALSCRSVYKTN